MLKRLLTNTVGSLVFSKATVVSNVEIEKRFKHMVLQAPGFVFGNAGDKIQLMLRNGSRTYTPMNSAPGRLEILCFIHDEYQNSVGAKWAREAKAGDEMLFFGPRKSIALSPAHQMLVGDETSIAIAQNAQQLNPSMRFVFEATSKYEFESVLRQFKIVNARVVERSANQAHWPEMGRIVSQETRGDVVFTGNAKMIQFLKKSVRARSTVKPYWAPGKKGLD
jgi:NADPH-dependent ferric siderophore reductase